MTKLRNRSAHVWNAPSKWNAESITNSVHSCPCTHPFGSIFGPLVLFLRLTVTGRASELHWRRSQVSFDTVWLPERERFGSNPLLQAVQRRERSWVRTEEGRENALEKERKLQLYRLKKLGVKCRTNVPQTIWWRAEYRGDSTLQIHKSTNMSVSDGADKRGNSMTWLMAGLGILHRLHPLCCTLALCEWLQMAEGCAGLQRAMITVINWEWEPRRTTMDQQNGPVKSVPCQAGKGHDAREKGSEYQLFLWCADV